MPAGYGPSSRKVYGEALHIVGLKEFQADLKRMGGDLPKELRKANLEAAKVVQSEAWRKAISLGGVAAKTAPTIRAKGQQRFASIAFGGPGYAMGANFGAYHDRLRNTSRGVVKGWNQFVAFRGNQWTGGSADQFFYWAIGKTREPFMQVYVSRLDHVAKKAFPD